MSGSDEGPHPEDKRPEGHFDRKRKLERESVGLTCTHTKPSMFFSESSLDQQFANRFSDEDEHFARHRAPGPPPVVSKWNHY